MFQSVGWTETPLQCHGLTGNSTRVSWVGQKLHWSAMGWPDAQLGAVGQTVASKREEKKLPSLSL